MCCSPNIHLGLVNYSCSKKYEEKECQMQTTKTFKKALSIVLLGGLLLSIGGVAMADSTNTKQVKKASKIVTEKRMHGMQKGRGMERGSFDAAKMQTNLKAKLATLVTAGTITQDQSDKILATFAQEQVTRAAEFAKIKAMTKTERQAYMQTLKGKRVNPMSQLVTDEVLTQAQADAIMPQRGLEGKGEKGRGMERGPVDSAKMQTNLKAKLATLVTAGTITQDQSDKILATFAQEQVTRAAEFAKIKAMTATERQAYMQTIKGKRVNPMSKLVTDGVLTQVQADAIAKAMPHRGPGHEGNFKKHMKADK